MKSYPEQLTREVTKGLLKRGQKKLPAHCFYDAVGSALFEAITLLPEYGLTRAESRLLQKSAGAIMGEAGMPRLVVELGSGSGTKTQHLLAHGGRLTYRPIDISPTALAGCEAAMSGLAEVEFDGVVASYLAGLKRALAKRPETVMLLFLGSTIGNFSKAETRSFLRKIRSAMRPGDTFLLGADLIKDRKILIAAYDDPTGVTAAFNKNILARVNRELDGGFDLTQFQHLAIFNEAEARIEMHLESSCPQEVHIGALNRAVRFEPGETIWTESCHKFRAEEICALGIETGWQVKRQWIDREWGFSETLFVA
jgi:dimethylhistidine N-methyltransferase